MDGHRIFLLAALFLLLSPGFAGSEEPAPVTGDPSGIAVTVVVLREENFSYNQEFSGIVEGLQTVQVRAQVDGILKEKLYREGAWVEKGTRLFQIEDAEYLTQVEMAEARLKRAEATLTNANREFIRANNLQGRNAISPKEYDAAATAHAEAVASAAEARAALNSARIKLEKTNILAPISGYTDMAFIQEGSLIAAASPSESLLTTVSNTREVRVLFHVPGVRVRAMNRLVASGTVRVQDVIPARLFVDAGVLYPHEGRLIFGSGAVNPQTGTMTAWAVFPNPENELSTGQIVRIRLSALEFPNALMLPQSALQQGADGPFVAIVTDKNEAAFAPVEVTGPYGSHYLAKPSEQIKAGVRVIMEGSNKVRSGMPVAWKQYEPAPR